MKAKEYLMLATTLSANKEEANLRSAVSRAYYAAFHAAREFILECGARLPKSSAAHDKLRWCLEAAEEAPAKDACAQLAMLRSARNEADYDLDSTRFRTAGNIKIHLTAAQVVFERITECRQDPLRAAVVARIQFYARDVLKIDPN